MPSKRKPKKGDLVRLTEIESPWVRGEWNGRVLRVYPDGDGYVKPLARYENVKWRVKPSREYVERGLYVTREEIASAKVTQRPSFKTKVCV